MYGAESSIISTTVTNITTIYPEQYIHGQCIIIGFNVKLNVDVFLNQARTWFLEIVPVRTSVCVSAPKAINN